MAVFRRSLSSIELRAAGVRLVNLHGRFADCFGRREAREHAVGYLRGLLLATGRNRGEPMALIEELRREQIGSRSLTGHRALSVAAEHLAITLLEGATSFSQTVDGSTKIVCTKHLHTPTDTYSPGREIIAPRMEHGSNTEKPARCGQ